MLKDECPLGSFPVTALAVSSKKGCDDVRLLGVQVTLVSSWYLQFTSIISEYCEISQTRFKLTYPKLSDRAGLALSHHA